MRARRLVGEGNRISIAHDDQLFDLAEEKCARGEAAQLTRLQLDALLRVHPCWMLVWLICVWLLGCGGHLPPSATDPTDENALVGRQTGEAAREYSAPDRCEQMTDWATADRCDGERGSSCSSRRRCYRRLVECDTRRCVHSCARRPTVQSLLLTAIELPTNRIQTSGWTGRRRTRAPVKLAHICQSYYITIYHVFVRLLGLSLPPSARHEHLTVLNRGARCQPYWRSAFLALRSPWQATRTHTASAICWSSRYRCRLRPHAASDCCHGVLKSACGV